MFKRINEWKPEPSEASNALLAERRLGQKDVEHARGCDEQARSAKLDSGDVGACALRSEPEPSELRTKFLANAGEGKSVRM
ncbi:MAG: hypothetical protein IJ877_05405, partial [Candidatus Gastranaerophilales bacterium]|nr:hypothetical protein [Candidatus Gastranaerophilales bacterium]